MHYASLDLYLFPMSGSTSYAEANPGASSEAMSRAEKCSAQAAMSASAVWLQSSLHVYLTPGKQTTCHLRFRRILSLD